MLSVLPLWVVLNTYAFLLDVLFIVGGTGSWLLFSSGYLFRGWVAAAISAIFIFSAVRVHLSYPAKLNSGSKPLYFVQQKRLLADAYTRTFDIFTFLTTLLGNV